MIRIKVNLGERSYPILIGYEIIDQIGFEIKKCVNTKKIMLVTNTTVNKLYAKRVMKSLKENGFSATLTVIPDGEKYKNIEQVRIIYEECIKNKLHRDSCIIALGGGVISDLAGFIAATYMRGIALVNIPTTLIGQVDAAIGGKTGINFKAKNIIGSFYQPKLVFIDTAFLRTLPEKEVKNGLAEVIKYAIIRDSRLFRLLGKNKKKIMGLGKDLLIRIVSRCCMIKAKIVEKDEKERGIRAILNYGHTIGHAIEKISYYRVPHGKSVAIGMIIEAKIAKLLNLLNEKQEKRVGNLIREYGLISDATLKNNDILRVIQFDKKVLEDKIRFVLPTRIGKVCIANVPAEIIKKALEP